MSSGRFANRPFDQWCWITQRWHRFRCVGMNARHGVLGYRLEMDATGRNCTWTITIAQFRRRIEDGEVVLLPISKGAS